MTEENDTFITKLPDSDQIPEILIIESNSGSEMHYNDFTEEENTNEEELDDKNSVFEEEYSNFSSFPDSTPHSENQFLDIKLENTKKESTKERSNSKHGSNCCLLI